MLPPICAPAAWVPISPLDEVRCWHRDQGRVPAGETGELCVRGRTRSVVTSVSPSGTARPSHRDGFYRSGDLACRVEIAGRHTYVLKGRTKDLINRGGEKINAEEVETCGRPPCVQEAALVAMPDPRLGERACAYVVAADPEHPPALADLTRHLEDLGVAKYKWPERMELIGELPRTQVGKVTKAVLRQDIRQRMGLEGITVG